MASDTLPPDEAVDPNDLDTLDEGIFTRQRQRSVDVEILRAVAAEVLYARTIRGELALKEASELVELVEAIAAVLGKTYV